RALRRTHAGVSTGPSRSASRVATAAGPAMVAAAGNVLRRARVHDADTVVRLQERAMTAEHKRLEEARRRAIPWKKWGPYLSERQWGTVREDYRSAEHTS